MAEAFEWYLKSAQVGYVPAMRITAYMYSGLYVEKDETESFRRYLKAANLGDKKSACEVVKHYAQGRGVEKNFEEALKLFVAAGTSDPAELRAGFEIL